MSIHFQTAAFLAPASTSGSQAKSRAHRHRQTPGSGAKTGPDPALVVGQPLPYMGTCKHYHHSHRSVTSLLLHAEGLRIWITLMHPACGDCNDTALLAVKLHAMSSR